MRIGYDAKRLFNNNTGLGNYSRTLVRDIQRYYPDNEYVLFSPKLKVSNDTEEFFTNKYELVRGKGLFWRTSGIKKEIKESEIDIYHGLSHELPIGIDKLSCKSVVTMHDLIYKFQPQDFSPIDRKIYDFKFKYACEHSDRIIAISESTKKDIVAHYGVQEAKVEVVYQTCADIFKQKLDKSVRATVLEKYKLPEHFLLYVGSIIERKQLLQIVKALKQLNGVVKLPLVVIGNGKKYKQQVLDYIKSNNLEQSVLFPDYVQNEDLPYVYNAARIFIYPSVYEGFGIPVIESLFCKTPVITSNLSSLPEAAGVGALYVEPDKPESIAHAIVQLLTNVDLYKQLITDGFDHVQKFNSEAISSQMNQLYRML